MKQIKHTNLLKAAFVLYAATTTAAYAATSFKDCDDCPEMVNIPGGSFTMGAVIGDNHAHKNEFPRRDVTLSGFSMSKTEITASQFKACVADGACRGLSTASGRNTKEGHPVTLVKWDQVSEYIDWLSRKAGKRYTLPSEAQWEYAARAGHDKIYGDTDNAGEVLENCFYCGGRIFGGIRPVGRYPPNDFGLHDMIGNVNEWTQDCAAYDLSKHPDDGSPYELPDCRLRAVRGGHEASNAIHARISVRSFYRVKCDDGELIELTPSKKGAPPPTIPCKVLLPWKTGFRVVLNR